MLPKSQVISSQPQLHSLRHLSRKLTRSIYSKAVSDLWRRADLEDTLRRQWLRNLLGDNPTQPDSYRGSGEWLHCLPGKWETALLDPVFRLGLCQRSGYPAPGPRGKTARAHSRPLWATCGMLQQRAPHKKARSRQRTDHKACRQAGLTATAEQAMLIPDQIMPDGQPAPGSVRPIHTADVHIIEPQGSELWLDVKILTMGPELSVAKELLREELTKCRAYGQREGYNLQALGKGMTPAVLEQYGRTAPGAQTAFNRMINYGLQFLVRPGFFFPRQEGRQLRAAGPDFTHPAQQHGRLMRSVHPKSARLIWATHPLTCQAPPGRHSE